MRHASVLVIFAALCVCLPVAALAQKFFPPVLYPTGGAAPMGVAIGDVNGDGNMDVVVTNDQVNGTIGVLLGNGDGTLRPAATYPAGSYPEFIVIADFNHDGHLDIAVGNRAIGTPGQVSILLGNGDGTFQARVAYGPFLDAFSLALGDIDADGNVDIVVGDTAFGSVLLGNGNGTFRTGPPVGMGNAIAFSVADFNADGKADLVGANNAGQEVDILLGDGEGNFTMKESHSVSTPPIAVVSGDFNGDGIPDFAVADEAVNNLNSNVTVFESSGGGFVSKRYPFGDEPRFITISKMTRTGRLYLVAGNEFNGTVDLFHNTKTGWFAKPVVVTGGAGVMGYLAVGTLNKDGKTDLVIADGFVDGMIRVFLHE